jgi:hypothetical protein
VAVVVGAEQRDVMDVVVGPIAARTADERPMDMSRREPDGLDRQARSG